MKLLYGSRLGVGISPPYIADMSNPSNSLTPATKGSTPHPSVAADEGADNRGPDRADDESCVTTFYNGSCPVCRMEIDHYRRITDKHALALNWADSSADKSLLKQHGIAEEDILKRLYALDTAGTLHGGVDAFILIWKDLPYYRWLGRFVALPGIKQIAGAFYDWCLAPALFYWNRKTGRI